MRRGNSCSATNSSACSPAWLQGMFIANQVDDAAMGATKSYTDFLQARRPAAVPLLAVQCSTPRSPRCATCPLAASAGLFNDAMPEEAWAASVPMNGGLTGPKAWVAKAGWRHVCLPVQARESPRFLPPRPCLQTRLSLNGGGDWQPLSRPERFTNPQCNTCKAGAPDSQCRLHLHGPTSWFAPEGAPPTPACRPRLQRCTGVSTCRSCRKSRGFLRCNWHACTSTPRLNPVLPLRAQPSGATPLRANATQGPAPTSTLTRPPQAW